MPPRPTPLTRTPQVVPPEDIPTVGVTDGLRSSSPPPMQHSPNTLEGNVSRIRPDQENPDQQMWNTQVPSIAPPQTKIVSPKVFSGWLTETHPDLVPMSKDAVIEVKGQWDDSGHALHNFGFGYNKISPSALGKVSLEGTDVLIVDCAGEIPPANLAVIEKFVAHGGYLITTDWALDGCLARAIPGYVEWNSGYSSSALVDAAINKNADPDLMKNVVPKAYWKLNNKCETVKIRRPDVVQVLARSRRLAAEDPDNHGYLAVTFPYGEGRVLHLVGHFDNNTDRAFNNALPDPAPKIGISLRQAIAANFIAAALKAHPRPIIQKK